MLKYLLLTPLNLLFTLVSYPMAPLVVLFSSSSGYLPTWLTWFQTFDASLDAGWQDGYFTVTGTPTGIARWWLRTRWLWRNPAYGFCYYPLGTAFNPADWTIDEVVFNTDSAGNNISIASLKAHDTAGHFSIVTSWGGKFGWKILNYIAGWNNDTGEWLPVWRTAPWGPVWRTPICFTL